MPGGAHPVSSSGVKCSPAVGAATDPGNLGERRLVTAPVGIVGNLALHVRRQRHGAVAVQQLEGVEIGFRAGDPDAVVAAFDELHAQRRSLLRAVNRFQCDRFAGRQSTACLPDDFPLSAGKPAEKQALPFAAGR